MQSWSVRNGVDCFGWSKRILSSWYWKLCIAIVSTVSLPQDAFLEEASHCYCLSSWLDSRSGRCTHYPSWIVCTGVEGLPHILSVLNKAAHCICNNLRAICHFTWVADHSELLLWVCTVRSEQGNTSRHHLDRQLYVVHTLAVLIMNLCKVRLY